ncbi:MAG: hypothetical protein FJX47_03540 [Alphaproteobacteria bacterium]|nr:hypothetical protein [Alphaproteobacteria bacterium]
MIEDDRRESIDRIRTFLGHSAQLLSEDLDSIFSGIDKVLSGINEAYVLFPAEGRNENPEVLELLRRRLTYHADLFAIALIGPEGQVHFRAGPDWSPARVDLSTRPYFLIHRGDPQRGLVIGAPETEAADGRPVIPVSRRLSGRDGAFLGVLVGAIDIARLRDLLRSHTGDVREGHIGLILDANGILIARHPRLPTDSGIDVSGHQTFSNILAVDRLWGRALFPLDGFERLFRSVRGPGHGVTTVFAASAPEVLARRQFERLRIAGAGALGTLILLVLAFVLDRQFLNLRRSNAESRRIRDAAEALRGRLIDAVETMNDGFALYSRNDRLVLVNRRLRELLPGTAEAVAPGRSFADAFHVGIDRDFELDGEDPAEFLARRNQARRERKPFRFYTRAGRYIEVIDWPTSEGGIASILRDVTEEVDREADLIAAKEDADLANQAKTEFMSRMTHDLGTPLHAILDFAQLLQTDPDQPLTEEQAKAIGQILAASNQLLALVDGILDHVRNERGQETSETPS